MEPVKTFTTSYLLAGAQGEHGSLHTSFILNGLDSAGTTLMIIDGAQWPTCARVRRESSQPYCMYLIQ